MHTSLLVFLKDKTHLLLMIIPLWFVHSDLQSQSNPYSHGKLVITFTDIRSDAGQIAMGLYNQADQWTDHPTAEFKWSKENLKNGRMTVVIDSLPRTIYACAVLDDEDMNQEMNYSFGLPKEGWGMSTNPSFLKLKKPTFNEVSFDLDAAAVKFEIKMNYLRKNKKVD